jgi:hypothetical protein
VKDRNLVLAPITVMVVSDGIPDMRDAKIKSGSPASYQQIDLSPLDYLSKKVTVRLVYASPKVGDNSRAAHVPTAGPARGSGPRQARGLMINRSCAILASSCPAVLWSKSPVSGVDARVRGWSPSFETLLKEVSPRTAQVAVLTNLRAYGGRP